MRPSAAFLLLTLAAWSRDAPASPPASPPLAGELTTLRAAAATAFGRPTSTRVVSDAFVLAAPAGDPLLSAAAARVPQALSAFHAAGVEHGPDHAVTVFVLSSRDAFNRFVQTRYGVDPGDYFGFFDRTRREIVASDVSTLTHELFHALPDFPSAPEWFQEGIASVYEAPVFRADGSIHGVKNWRYDTLRKALDAGGDAAPRLDSLFGMTRSEFEGHGDADPDVLVDADEARTARLLHYALARYVCQWMDERGKLWPFYTAWRDGFLQDRLGRKTFAQVVGKMPEDANAEWVAWVRAL
jgi:hypothetical protein